MNACAHVIEQAGQPSFRMRVGRLGPLVGFYAIPLLAGVLLLAGVWFQPWVPVADLLRDPLSVAELSNDCCGLYYGAVSNLGVLIWAGGAAVCLFAGLVLHGLSRWSTETAFMLYAGFLTGLLAVDDLFLLHDFVLPHFGVPQLGIYAAYGALAAIYLVCFRREILARDAAVFLAAGALLATSVGIDQVIHSEAPIRIFVEDGAKLLGIILWTAFHVRTALTLCCGTARFARLDMAPGRGAVVVRGGSRS